MAATPNFYYPTPALLWCGGFLTAALALGQTADPARAHRTRVPRRVGHPDHRAYALGRKVRPRKPTSVFDVFLPMDDEPAIPATGRYVQVHTSMWSETISNANAVVFVTPQYNWGYPAPLKNAIDHLYGERRDKAAVIVTYGGHGGTKCSEQLKQVAGAVWLRLAPTTSALVLPEAVIRDGAALDPNRDFSLHITSVQGAFAELADLLRVEPA